MKQGILVQVFSVHYTQLCAQKHNLTLTLITVKAIILLTALFKKKKHNISEVCTPVNSFIF